MADTHLNDSEAGAWSEAWHSLGNILRVAALTLLLYAVFVGVLVLS